MPRSDGVEPIGPDPPERAERRAPKSAVDLGCVVLFLVGLGIVATVFLPTILRCVLEGTLVDTPGGPVAIESLRVGDAVWARAPGGGVQRGTVVAVRRGYAFRYRRLGFEDGRTLAVTPSHPVANSRGEYLRAGSIEVGARVASRQGPLRLTSVESRIGWARVYDLTVEPGESFFANGVLVHNKSRPFYESALLGDLRTLISAQSAYQEINAGCYEARLECLVAPGVCVPTYPQDGPGFLDEKSRLLASEQPVYGYVREFIPGPSIACPPDASSPTSVASFAYRAVPFRPEKYAVRGFCADQSGAICATPNGELPPVKDGHCVFHTAEEPSPPHPHFSPDSPCVFLD